MPPRLSLAVLFTAAALCACQSRPDPKGPAGLQEARLGFDVQPIDAANLLSQATHRHRALMMPAGEVAARLGAFVLEEEDRLEVREQNSPVLQQDRKSRLVWDRADNLHLITNGNGNGNGAQRGLELWAIGQKAYVRLDRGHLRYKSRRDVDVLEMVHAATGGLWGTLSAVGGAQLSPPSEASLGSTAVWRYALGRKERELGEAPLAHAPRAPGALAEPLPAAWSQNASHKELDGHLCVDAATGVVLRAELHASLQVAVGGRTLQVALGHKRHLRPVPQMALLTEPSGAIAEYKRPNRPRDALHFFAAQLHAGPDGVLSDAHEAEPSPPKKTGAERGRSTR